MSNTMGAGSPREARPLRSARLAVAGDSRIRYRPRRRFAPAPGRLSARQEVDRKEAPPTDRPHRPQATRKPAGFDNRNRSRSAPPAAREQTTGAGETGSASEIMVMPLRACDRRHASPSDSRSPRSFALPLARLLRMNAARPTNGTRSSPNRSSTRSSQASSKVTPLTLVRMSMR